MSELPNPVNFAAVTASVTPGQVREEFACGPDPERHLAIARQFADAGFDHLVAMNAGPDPDGFMRKAEPARFNGRREGAGNPPPVACVPSPPAQWPAGSAGCSTGSFMRGAGR